MNIIGILATMELVEIKEIRARIGKALKKLRKEEKISSLFLAKVLGVAQPTVSRIENGTTSISAERLCFLAKSFNRPLSYFIGEQSVVIVNEQDVIIAGLVFYGATQLKSKRNIDATEHYRTYADLLNAALKISDNPRITTAIAATIIKQSSKNNLNPLQIVSTIVNFHLKSKLYKIAGVALDASELIVGVNKDSKRKILELRGVLQKELQVFSNFDEAQSCAEKFLEIDITPEQVAKFVEECT